MLDLASIANICVAAATAWLAWVTYGVAKTSRDALLLQTQPYLAFEGISLETGQLFAVTQTADAPALRVGIQLSNPGQVLVTYEIDDVSLSLNGQIQKLEVFLSRGGKIFPHHKENFYLPVLSLGSPLRAGTSGELHARISFWADPEQRQQLTLRHQMNVKSTAPQLVWEWVALQVPTYEKY